MRYTIREAASHDAEAMLALLPRLAAFEVPARRVAEDLWRGDERMLRAWLAGDAPDCILRVAAGADDGVLGLCLTRLRPELLSAEPSAHLEVLAVAATAEGRGIGRALIVDAEARAGERGARSMTLHVFAANERARGVYEGLGYDGELIRYIKPLA